MYEGLAVWVFETDALAVIVAVLCIDNDCLGDVVIVEEVVDVLEAREELEPVGELVIVLEVLADALTVGVVNPLLVAGGSLVTVALILLHAEYEPEKLVNALCVVGALLVTVTVLVIVFMLVAESVLVTVNVLVIRLLTELVLETVEVLVICGVNVCVTELVVVADCFVVLVSVGQLVGVLLTTAVRDTVGVFFIVKLTNADAVELFDKVDVRVDVVELVVVLELVTLRVVDAEELVVFELVVVDVPVCVKGPDFERAGDAVILGDEVDVLEDMTDLDNVGVAVFVLDCFAE